MLYHLGLLLKSHWSVFNVLTYITVRAGGAVVTGFVISMLVGPPLIRALRALKLGQHIRQDYVADLHALHNHKAGTPTMGGAMIILSCIATLLLWGHLTNRLLIIAAVMLVALGAIGFADDYVGLRKKRNLGLTAKAKFIGQIAVGVCLGGYLYLFPITSERMTLTRDDVLNWDALERILVDGDVYDVFPNARDLDAQAAEALSVRSDDRDPLWSALNILVNEADLYAGAMLTGVALSGRTQEAIAQGDYRTSKSALRRLNRLLLADAFPRVLASPQGELHTRVEIPGLKNVMVPLGMAYILFVTLIIVASSNAVNLTDGLDGLAIGASIISLFALTAIAYVVGRADWTRYLYVVYVPEASELTVLGAALMGCGLGFLWFNSHPAEVFMGDTGSLALGGALGTMAILTKQELLLIVVGGLFVMEAASVILQVASFKLTGKRLFRMAPLHHHFELKGWSESKVTIRFWILAFLFALLSLVALKLR